MKTFRIAFLFIVLSFSAFAKDSTTVEFKRFALGIHISPNYAFRTIAYNTSNQTGQDPAVYIITHTEGLDLSYFIKKQFSVSLGVNYSLKGYRSDKFKLYQHSHFYSSEIGEGYYEYNFHYIEIPVRANFTLGEKNIRLFASAEVTPAFMLYEQDILITNYYNGEEKITKGKPNYIYNPFNLFVGGSVGVNFKLGKQMELKVAPTGSYGLFTTIDSFAYTEHLWSVGLDFGLYLRF